MQVLEGNSSDFDAMYVHKGPKAVDLEKDKLKVHVHIRTAGAQGSSSKRAKSSATEERSNELKLQELVSCLYYKLKDTFVQIVTEAQAAAARSKHPEVAERCKKELTKMLEELAMREGGGSAYVRAVASSLQTYIVNFSGTVVRRGYQADCLHVAAHTVGSASRRDDEQVQAA